MPTYPWQQFIKAVAIVLEQPDQESMGLPGVHFQLVAIQAQEHVGRRKGHALVSVDERAVHDQGLNQRRCHFGEIGVVTRAGPVRSTRWISSTSSRLRKATVLPGKQPAQFFVFFDGIVEVRQDFRAYAPAPDVVADSFREQTGHVLVSLFGERLELVSSVLVDFRTGLDTLHMRRMVYGTRYVMSAGWSKDR